MEAEYETLAHFAGRRDDALRCRRIYYRQSPG